VTCREVIDRLGDAIDRGMSEEVRAEFFGHLDVCPLCRAKYELERMCKHIVGQKLQMVATPADVRHDVQTILLQEDASPPGRYPSWLDRILNSKALAPVLVAGLAVVAVLFFLSRPQQIPEEPAPPVVAADIVQQSMVNFTLIRSGDLKPSMTVCSPDSVLAYLQNSGIPFPAKVLRLKDCQSYGVIVNEVNGVPLAHLVYALNESTILYVYETAEDEAWKGTSLSLPGEAKEALARTGWYFFGDEDRGNLLLRTVNGTLISAVSMMPKDEMMALLSSN
jgi:hypothetical protein